MKKDISSRAQLLMDGHDYIHPALLKTYDRRQALNAIGGFAGLLMLAGCAPLSSATDSTSSASGGTAESSPTNPGTCSVIPTETEGPYPASQVLNQSWIYRSDIREDRTGVPMNLILNIFDTNNSCNPISNAAVYIWHCDKDGNYSGYNGYKSATFLRGVQTTDSNGKVSFQTIYPGWYAGRITHVHFEIFLNNSLSSTPKKVSQLAFPQATTQAVYASDLYKAKGQNTSVTSFSKDNVFSDGVQLQLATMTGDIRSGYTAQLNVGIAL